MIRQRGFTLTETVIFILVLAVGLTGIVNLSTTASRDSAQPMVRERALAIAHAYMDEIISKRWDENTPVGGGCVDTDLATDTDSCTAYCNSITSASQCNRSKCFWDTSALPATCVAAANVSAALGVDAGETRSIFNDIDDYHGYGPTPPQTILEANAPGYSNDYSAVVIITVPAWQGIAAADVRRIAVTVTGPLGETLTLISYRVNF